MGLAVNPLDFLSTANLVIVDNVIFWEKSAPKAIEALDSDTDYTIKIQERPDSISVRQLQSKNLGWTVMDRNNMRLWPNDMVPGVTIQVPSRESLDTRGIPGGRKS